MQANNFENKQKTSNNCTFVGNTKKLRTLKLVAAADVWSDLDQDPAVKWSERNCGRVSRASVSNHLKNDSVTRGSQQQQCRRGTFSCGRR